MTIKRTINDKEIKIKLTRQEMTKVYEEIKKNDIKNFVSEKLKMENHNTYNDNKITKLFCSLFFQIWKHYDSSDDEEIFNLVLERIDSVLNCNNN